MVRRKGLTLIELLCIIAITALLIGILLPALEAARKGPRRSTQFSGRLGGIHVGLVLYAQGNNGWYPGISKDGTTIDPAVGLTVTGRIQKLIDDNYFSAEYARSPSEAQTGTTSYALLQVDVSADVAGQVAHSVRNSEWRHTTNTNAIVVSDRAVSHGSDFGQIKSIHTTPASGVSDWRGSVAWNDNHVTFESTHTLSTKYNDVSHANDHLFINQTGDAHTGSDAFMVYSGTNEL
jgi:type II secretory pathway pseudopilin PulG